MIRYKKRPQLLLIASLLMILLGGMVILLTATHPAIAEQAAQLPTVAMATVTSTPYGPYITVNLDQDQVNVRS